MKVPAIFHNIRGYGSHLIKKEIFKFYAKVSFIANGLDKCMAFAINNNLFLLTICNLLI